MVFAMQSLKTKMFCQCCDFHSKREGDKIAKQIYGRVASHFEGFSYSLALFDTVICYCLVGQH